MASLLWIAPLIVSSQILSNQSERPGIDEITAEVRSGRYNKAIALADGILAGQPRDVRALTLKAVALTKLGQQDAAESSFRAALAVDPNYVAALAGASELEYKAGTDIALQHVDKLLQLRPTDQTAHAMRAVIAWRRHDCRTVVQHFDAALDVIADQPAALRQYGLCLASANRTEEAIKRLEQVVLLKPGDHRARADLAYVQMSAGRDKSAMETLGPELARAQPDPESLAIAAEVYERTGDTPRAVSTLRQAIIADPDRESLYLSFASICFDHKAFAVGVDMVNAGLTKLPSSARLHLARGVLYAQMAEYAKADDDFELAQILDPGESVGPGAKALALFQSGSLDEALSTVRANLSAHPADPFLHYLLAEILSKKGLTPGSRGFTEAVAEARKAVQLQPSFNLARDVLSRLYLASGNARGAIEQCRLALANDPSDQMAIYRLIRALNAAGNPSRTEISDLTKRLAQVRRAEEVRQQQTARFRLEEPVPAHAE